MRNSVSLVRLVADGQWHSLVRFTQEPGLIRLIGAGSVDDPIVDSLVPLPVDTSIIQSAPPLSVGASALSDGRSLMQS